MNTLTNEFKNACCNTTDRFDALVNALQLPRRVSRSEVRHLLSFIDSVIDYYLTTDHQLCIRFPIVFIPCVKDWAEEVCIEYVAYKTESAFDADRMLQVDAVLKTDINATNRGLDAAGQGRYLRKESNWRKRIRPIVRKTKVRTNARNLIVCGSSIYNRIKDKDDLIHFLGDSPKTSITCSAVLNVEEEYDDYRSFENVFCFYSNNGICDDYELYNLNNWEGLRNCFIFEFNSSPYCLDNVLKCGIRLCDKFPHKNLLSKDETQRNYQDYITLTNEEAHYIFNRDSPEYHKLIQFPTEIEDEREYIIDFYKGYDSWRFSIKDRNILSLCLCQKAMDRYLNYIHQEKPSLFEDDWWKTILDTIIKHFPMTEIIDRIRTFVQFEKTAAFIICDAPNDIRDAVKDFFIRQGLKIQFYQYKDLKDRKVKQKKIVVLRFCPHNLSSKNYPHKNPNSFDEFSLEEGQSLLDIINELTILDYSKYKYDYDLYLCLATSSVYRRDVLGGELNTPIKPKIQYISHYSELDDDANETSQNTIPTVRFEFSDGTSCTLPENEMLICENEVGERYIESIRNLKELEQLNTICAIQPIYELADKTIDVFFDDARNTTPGIENKWRDELVKQGLIPKDHCREVPIWKFLLERKVRDYCVEKRLVNVNQQEPLWPLLRKKINDEQLQNLYKELGVKVQLERVLRDWCDVTKVDPIIPGFKKDRENLMRNYLRLNRGEISLYRKKQLLTRNMTWTRNSVTEGFLSRILFDDITDDLVAELLEDSQYSEYIAIDTKEDIEALKSIAEEKINLKTINTISL